MSFTPCFRRCRFFSLAGTWPAGLGNEQSLTAFFLMWISLYAVFAVLAVFLGKARYLRPGGVLLAAGVNLTLMLVYYLFA